MASSPDPRHQLEAWHCPFMDCEFYTLTKAEDSGISMWKEHFIGDHRQYFEENEMKDMGPLFSARRTMWRSGCIYDPFSWQNNIFETGHYSPRLANAAERPIRRWDAEWIALWLLMHRFSTEWRETIRTLDLEGDQFLKLGKKRSTLAGVGTLHTKVYPELARVCVKNGVPRPSTVQRGEEGKRLQKLIAAVTARDTFHLTPETQAATDLSPVYGRGDPNSSKLVQWAHDMPSSANVTYAQYNPPSVGVVHYGPTPPSVGVVHYEPTPPSVGVVHYEPTPPSAGGLASYALPELSIDIPFAGSGSFGPKVEQTVNSATSGQIANYQEYPYPEPWLSGSPHFVRPHSAFPAVDGQGPSMQEKMMESLRDPR